MYIWYFHESEAIKPVRRGIQKSYQLFGSAAADAALMPFQWIMLLLYSVTKDNNDVEPDRTTGCCTGCIKSFKACVQSIYFATNRCSPAAAVITNTNFIESCQRSAKAFALNNHRFYNIGGTLTIFLTLFCCIFWILISFIIMDATIYNTVYPPPVSSLALPLFAVFLMGLVIGSLFANLFTSALDCLLFCYLMEKET